MKALNVTNINKEVFKKVLRACTLLMNHDGFVAHIENKKCHAIMAVRRIKVGSRTMFKITNSNNDNMADILLESAKRLQSKVNSSNLVDFVLTRVAFNHEIAKNEPLIPITNVSYNGKGELYTTSNYYLNNLKNVA